MYSETIISTLAERIGFGTPQEEGFAIELDEANLQGDSGRVFKSFHALVTPENIHAAVVNSHINEADFNAILNQFRDNAVREILPLIMDKNELYDTSVEYDSIIESSVVLFDDAIGYKVAVMVLEMFISSSRSNLLERNAKFAVGNLKLELEGFRNDTGFLVANGLVQKLDKAILKASNKIFPRVIEVRDGSYNW